MSLSLHIERPAASIAGVARLAVSVGTSPVGGPELWSCSGSCEAGGSKGTTASQAAAAADRCEERRYLPVNPFMGLSFAVAPSLRSLRIVDPRHPADTP
jgi:hypothetical protein